MESKNITNLAVHSSVCEILKDKDSDFCLKATCSLGLLIGVATQDRKITSKELSYLKRYSRYFLKIDKERSDDLTKIFILAIKSDPSLLFKFKSFKKYLGEKLSQLEKKELVETLIVIARSDLEIDKREKEFISDIASFFEIRENKTSESFLNAYMIISQKINEEIQNNQSLHSTQEEVNKLELCSYQEFYSDTLKKYQRK